ncbi:hypothetical protein EC991_011185, partial [Linnemannia zychae]
MTTTPQTPLHDNTDLPPIQQLVLDTIEPMNPTIGAAATAEDVDMTDSLPTSPAPSVIYHDLSQFSATHDPSYDSDDQSADLQEILVAKRNRLHDWRKAYRQTLLKIEKNSPEHPSYAIWRTELAQLEHTVRGMTEDLSQFTKAMGLGQTTESTIISPSVAVATVANTEGKKLSLDSGTPRFGDAKMCKGQLYFVTSDPHIFLDAFRNYCESSYGQKAFLASASRLMIMAILHEQTRQQFSDAIAGKGDSTLTWEECEEAFVNSVLTPIERFRTVANVAETGRKHKETYRNFALRLQRMVRVYRIDDGNSTVLSGIMRSIPSLELSLIKNALQKAGTSLTEVKLDSINE